ncbi:MMPL family transporter [Haloechinothrix salitolerans]|uniref:MMPL family transporter n=1 Tax=Haloechinothrix salitolerans TaxID=926830 RepID=A0ABW2C3A9_9PSEU
MTAPAPRSVHSRVIATTLIGVLSVLAVGGLLQVRIDTSMRSFLPAGDPAYEQMEAKAREFGGDPVVVLLESEQPRQLILEQDKLLRLLRLEGKLDQLPDVADVYGPATILNQTAGSAQNLLARLSGHRDALRNLAVENAKERGADDAEAEQAGGDAVARFDERYGTLLVKGLPAGLPTLRNPKFVASVVFGDNSEPRPQWRAVVPDTRTVAVLVRPRANLDQGAAGRLTDAVRSTVDDAGLGAETTVTGVPVVASGLSDRAQQEMPVLGAVAVVAVGIVFVALPWSRRRRARLRPLAVALGGTALTLAAFGWLQHPLSLGVVAFLPILMGIGSDYPFYLSQPGHRRRVVVTAVAGATAFASLALSPLPFVRELGIALAVGVLVILGLALVVRRMFGPVPGADLDSSGEDAAPRPVRHRWWPRLVALGLAVLIAGLGWAALPRIGIEARPDQLADGLPELADVRTAERVLGSSSELSIVLRGDDVLSTQALAWTRQTQEALVREHGDQLHPIVSIADLLRFLGSDPSASQLSAAIRLLPSYLTSAVAVPDGSAALMTFGVAPKDVDRQRKLVEDIRRTMPPPPPGIDAEVVGIPVLTSRGLDLVSGGRTLINLTGIALVGLVLALGLSRRKDAAWAVLTVLLAIGWVLALVWLLAGSLNPLTVAIGSLTTATGCEFAVMMTGRGRSAAGAWRRVGIAALAATAGYLVLALSGLALLREFGVLLAAGVVCSYLAALLVTGLRAPRQDDDCDESPTRVPATKKEVTA